MERKKTLFERVRKNSTVDEEVENEGEEEDESGVNITEEEKKIGVSSGGGRRGSSGGGGGVSPPSCQAERCGNRDCRHFWLCLVWFGFNTIE